MSPSSVPATFFENQAAARNKTALLVFYFACAVGVIIAGIYIAVMVLLANASGTDSRVIDIQRLSNWWQPEVLFLVAVATLLVILIGSAVKIAQLSSGGAAVARLLGGEPVNPSTTDPDQRRLLNVVEEMSIASGIRIPSVFVLPDQSSINAFAAGLTTRDAVIAVTKGCMEKLTRDELQGVVAHEFSHVLNSDMRLNLRLMGVLFGLLLIAIIGRQLMRTRGKKNALPLIGLALFILGYAGVFFGNLIKCAISRQREFLADASSVQFTRNPLGIGGALKKIAEEPLHGIVSHAHAEEASHFFFADGIKRMWGGALATHPPIDERLRRLRLSPAQIVPRPAASGDSPQAAGLAAVAAFSASDRLTVNPAQIVGSAGTLDAAHVVWARTILDSLPPVLKDAVREPQSARAVVYCLLTGSNKQTADAQAQILAREAQGPANTQVAVLSGRVKQLDPAQTMALADLAINGLRSLPAQQYETFRTTVWNMINADSNVTLFEYMLQRMIVRHLDPLFGRPLRPKDVRASGKDPATHTATLLSAVAYCGAADDTQAAKAFAAGMERMQALVHESPAMSPRAAAGLPMVDKALSALGSSPVATRQAVLDACAATVAVDGVTTTAETVVLRAIADALGCPVPPVLTQAGSQPQQRASAS